MIDYCKCCGRSIPVGQALLSDDEIRRLPMTGYWDVIRWQVVKGAAEYFDVDDWVQRADTSLTYEENIELMRQSGSGPTMREMGWLR